MKYTVKEMPDGTVEVLQSDGGEEILGRLVFRNLDEFDICFDRLTYERDGYEYIDHDHPGGKYLSPNQPLSPRNETGSFPETGQFRE